MDHDTMNKRRSAGRQKIEIKKISKKSSLEVTFTKRRNGLFNKASELCLLTGSEAAVFTFSPANRPYAFGYPSTHRVIDKLLAENSDIQLHAAQAEGSKRMYMDAIRELEKGKEKSRVMQEMKYEGFGGGFWWNVIDIEDMEINELEEYIASLEELEKNIAARIH